MCRSDGTLNSYHRRQLQQIAKSAERPLWRKNGQKAVALRMPVLTGGTIYPVFGFLVINTQ